MAGKYKTKQQSAIKECLEMHKDGYVTVMDIENYLKENDCQVGLTTFGEDGKGWHCNEV